MTEREKMLAGMLYDGNDPELLAARARARAALRRLDLLDGPEERHAALRGLLGAIGENSAVMPGLRCDYGTNIRIGRDCFVNFDAVLLDCAAITLGDGVQLAPRVQLLTATHPLDRALRRAGPEYARPIRVGDECWIGAGAIVLPGLVLGEGSVIGAGAVVTRDVPAGMLAVGNPARAVRRV